VSFYAEPSPVIQLPLHRGSGGLGLQAKRVAAEIDPWAAIGSCREEEEVAIAPEGIGGIHLEGKRLVGSEDVR
jgi:hypothetical protein